MEEESEKGKKKRKKKVFLEPKTQRQSWQELPEKDMLWWERGHSCTLTHTMPRASLLSWGAVSFSDINAKSKEDW